MDKEYVMHIAQTIKEQLLSFTPIPVFMSWGVSEFVATVFQELPALRLCRYRSQRLLLLRGLSTERR